MLDTTDPRSLLRAAIADRDAAAQAEIDAARAVVRAAQILEEAKLFYSALAGVDDEIVAHRASEIRAWAAAAGGERPSDALPPHLARKQELKVETEAKLSAARSAHEVLRNELVTASGQLQKQQVAVYRAAGVILSSGAPALIEDLRQARRAVWALEDTLRTLGAVRFFETNGQSVLIKMPPETFAALSETAPPMLALSVPKPYAAALAAWQRYLESLTHDPDSQLDSI
jgi:hypothetical protein